MHARDILQVDKFDKRITLLDLEAEIRCQRCRLRRQTVAGKRELPTIEIGMIEGCIREVEKLLLLSHVNDFNTRAAAQAGEQVSSAKKERGEDKS